MLYGPSLTAKASGLSPFPEHVLQGTNSRYFSNFCLTDLQKKVLLLGSDKPILIQADSRFKTSSGFERDSFTFKVFN